MRALALRREPWGEFPLVRLYHLHGAATWVRRVKSNEVVKVRLLQDLRDHKLWQRWQQGKSKHLEPVVVLGDRKDRLITREPFDRQYGHLQTAVSRSDEIVVAGYGFGDVPLNEALRASLSASTQVCVINPDKRAKASAKAALGRDTVTFIHEGLPEGLSTWWKKH